MREMIDSEYRVIHRVVKIPFEFDNEIYALNSSKPWLKSRKKKKEKKKGGRKKKQIISSEGNYRQSSWLDFSPLANKEFLFSTIRGWLLTTSKRWPPDEPRGSLWTVGMQRRKLGMWKHEARIKQADRQGGHGRWRNGLSGNRFRYASKLEEE